MEAFKILLFVAFLSLIVTNVRVEADDSDVDGEVKVTRTEGPDSSIFEQLKSKILNLESHVEKQSKDIEDKNNVIAIKEETIREKAERITSLESEMASLQRKGKTDAAEQLEKAHAKAAELEKQVEKLTKDIGVTIKEKELLEVRIVNSEKKLSEADSKSESLQKTIDDLKSKLRKTERALQIAEEEMIKAKFEATSKVKELVEVHGAWLPPWLAVHCNNYQSLFKEKWKVHGKPALERLKQKATEKKASVKEWAAPLVDTVNTKLVPVIKEQWEVVITKVEPHVQMVSRKTVDFYEVSKDTVTPHIIKAWELADPYFQELRKSSKPYIDQIATAFKPYTDEVVQASEKFLESATVYHRQVQEIVHAKLKSHELTEPLATKEFVWYSASILLALPILFLFKICFPTSSKKETRPIRNANPSNSRRKGKRVHHEDARNEVIGGIEGCVAAVEKILKYGFKDKKYLEEALTHPSCAESASYQRLEFIGDAALALAVSNFAYLKYRTADCGKLSLLRSANLSTEKLARVAVRHELYKYVRRNAAALDDKVSEFVTAVQQEDLVEVYGGLIKAPKVLADIVESIAAAVYIDCNFDLKVLWKIFRDLLEPIMLDELEKQPQPVTMLIELCQKNEKEVAIKYSRKDERNIATVYVDGDFVAACSSEHKEIAKLNVAKIALQKLSFASSANHLLSQISADSEDGAKQMLHELCDKKKWRRPTYEIERKYGLGLSHEKRYVCSVEMDIIEGKISVEGGEKFRVKEAENSAAFSMLHRLKDNNYL